MLNLHSNQSHQTCDGVSRRGFLQIGSLGIAGLTLADLLSLEAAGVQTRQKAIINIDLRGGPPHQDLFDLKPSAPSEYRGEFKPIASKVPGLQICELLPNLAKLADQFAVIRSLVGSSGGHGGNQVQTGYSPKKAFTNVGGPPSIGAVVSKLQGSGPNGAPAWIANHVAPYGYLGPTHKGFTPKRGKGGSLVLNRSLSAERLKDRTQLLSQIDKLRRDVDRSGQMEAFDSYTQRAYEMITSGKVADALDVSKEDPRIKDRYGKAGEQLLRARRLIEAGVRVITTDSGWGGWDTHKDNFKKLKTSLPKMDQGLSALLEDLKRLGMEKDVTVVMWGEFGRTPKVNKRAGRDHWPKVAMAFLAGGDMKLGQAIGQTDSKGGYAVERPIDYQEVFATLYRNLGIDTTQTTIIDPSGRPQFLVDSAYRKPIAELV